MRRFLPWCLLVLVVGCHNKKEDIPTYPLMSVEDSRAVLAKRARMTHNVSAQGTVTMIDENGDDIRFDAAVVMEMPDRARIRAYKMGQAVFDLTMTHNFVYLYAPRGEGEVEIEKAGSNAGEMARWWLRQMSRFFNRTDLKWDDRASTLTATGTDPQGRTITAVIDRKTLTVREWSIPDTKGSSFTMKLSRYQPFTNVLGFEQDWPKYGQITPEDLPPQKIEWPTKIEAISPRGTIVIELRDVEINTSLPPKAFDPPARAKRLP